MSFFLSFEFYGTLIIELGRSVLLIDSMYDILSYDYSLFFDRSLFFVEFCS